MNVPSHPTVADRVATYPLLSALLNRRSRRFGQGLTLDGGSLTYQSENAPSPLTEAEQAALAFAASGVTGPVLAELPFENGKTPLSGHGNIMVHLVGRTVPSGDAVHTVSVFMLDDNGAWLLRRPQDMPITDIPTLVSAAHEHRLVDHYQQLRVKIADSRPTVSREIPYTMPFNKWSVNLPGTTTFVPVAELTALCINILLTGLTEEVGYFLLDDRNNYQPAGLAAFAKSRGGHLDDNPAHNRIATISIAESWVYEFAAIEQGAVLQNLGLMAEALGIGGFPYFAAHPYGWTQALRFRMEPIPFKRTAGFNPLLAFVARAMNRDQIVPTAVGLEREGRVLLKPFCPPYYRNMEEAVIAFVEYKFAPERGTLRNSETPSAWQTPEPIRQTIPRPSDKAIAATIAYCDYAYRRYGRFPPGNGPFRTVLAYQAAHLDPAFYAKFYL